MSAGEEASWLWRQALQIAHMFPEKRSEARLVLFYVEKLVELGFDPPPMPPAPNDDGGGQLVRFPGAANSPSRRASSSGSASVLPK